MTGRRLYDHFTDAAASHPAFSYDNHTQLPGCASGDGPARAWPFLSGRDRRVWNALARSITPKRAKP